MNQTFNMNEIEKISSKEWIQRWAGSFTFTSCDYWGKQYLKSLNEYLGISFEHSLFIHKKGTVSFYLVKSEFEKFGNVMAKKVIADRNFAEKNLDTLRGNADKINSIMKKLHGTIPTKDQYQEFLFLFEKHLPFHSFMKKTVDFMDEKNLKPLMPLFKETRIYTENVYSNTETFFRSIADIISKKSGYNSNFLTCLTQEEFENYLTKQELPEESILENRFSFSVLYFDNEKRKIILGKDADLLEVKMIEKEKNVDTLNGTGVYPGLVKGIARIAPDPFKVSKFDEGDILVTGMTRPEFLPLIKKAKAIITDVGGALCHAAIMARELKKPCIVGTRIATKVLKDGDLVEVDADKGIVKIINRA